MPPHAPPTDQPTPIRDAASVVLIRDGEAAPEAFTLTRASTMAFSAGATVFPGGGTDDGDDLPESAFVGVDVTAWATSLDEDPAMLRRLLVTAVRETFEECGVLLARTQDGDIADPQVHHEARAALEAHETTLGEFFAAHQLRPDFALLRPLARWITPPDQPRRYDTRFFLAALPAGQQAVHTTGEAVATRWMTAHRARELFRAGETDLMPPTWSQFRALEPFADVAQVLSADTAAAGGTAAARLPVVSPTTVPGPHPRQVRFPHWEQYYADSPAHRHLTPGS